MTTMEAIVATRKLVENNLDRGYDATSIKTDQLALVTWSAEVSRDRIVQLETALKDAISTYTSAKDEILVTVERVEAWQAVLNP